MLSEIAEPLPALIEQYPDIYWYCNCGAGFPENPGLAQSTDNGAEIAYTAGYATGLLLQAKGRRNSTTFIGCCDLGFEKQSYLAYERRPEGRRPGVHDDVRPDGRLPVRLRQHRQRDGCVADAPSTRAPTLCTRTSAAPTARGAGRQRGRDHHDERRVVEGLRAGEELKYDIAVKFDGGDYVRAVMAGIIDGTFQEGDIKTFKVGVDPRAGRSHLRPDAGAADGDGRRVRADRLRRARRSVGRDLRQGVCSRMTFQS